jgi:predicted ArsR family transcriptional regulator
VTTTERNLPQGVLDVVELAIRQGQVNMNDLLDAFDVSRSMISQWVMRAEVEGFVRRQRLAATPGPGRKPSSYEVTARGRELFSRRDSRTLSDALIHVREAAPETLNDFYKSKLQRWVERKRAAVGHLPAERRQEDMKERYEEGAFVVDLERPKDGVTELVVYHCPFRLTWNGDNPLLCGDEADALKQAYGAKTSKRTEWMGDGDRVCRFRVTW